METNQFLHRVNRIIPLKKSTHYKQSELANSNVAIVLAEHKAVYFPIPKVACSSLKKIFAEALNLRVETDSQRKSRVHAVNFSYITKSQLKDYKNYYKFCFVRNPWDRIVSCYREKIKKVEQRFSKDIEMFNYDF